MTAGFILDFLFVVILLFNTKCYWKNCKAKNKNNRILNLILYFHYIPVDKTNELHKYHAIMPQSVMGEKYKI